MNMAKGSYFMKKISALFYVFLLLSSLSAYAAEPPRTQGASGGNGMGRDFRSELTGGMWHAGPALGSGWANRLALLDDSTFIYAASEMDGATRERFITGEWSVSPDGLLTLLRRETLKWEGGEVVPATGSTGTKTEIINAALVKVKHDPAKKIVISVGKYVYDGSMPRPWKISLPDAGAIWGGDGWWWKYEGDGDLNELKASYERARAEAGNKYGASQKPLGTQDFSVSDGKNTIVLDSPVMDLKIDLPKKETTYVGEVYSGDFVYKVHQHAYADFDLFASNANYNLKGRNFDDYHISQITLKSPNFKTFRGIAIGSAVEDLIRAYGPGEKFNRDGAVGLRYTFGDMNLEFGIKNQRVQGITASVAVNGGH